VNTAQQETMETLLELQEKGKIRYIGVSNYSVAQLQECLQVGQVVSMQPEYSLLQRDIEKEIVPFCLENDVGIIAYSPLASGVLTGKYDKNTQFKDWRGKGIIGVFSGEGYVKNIAKVDRLKDVAKSLGKTCGQTAINWVTRQRGLTTALIGVKNARQMEENLQSVGWQPDAEQMQSMDEIF
jgi:aryl-alcohol dehydrogenase-like predicted oxidoreductase